MTLPQPSPATPSALASEVFECVSARFAERGTDFSRFVVTGYSFDEWLVWEAFLACAAQEGWTVSPRPAYASVGVHGDADFGDLLVRRGAESVIVELGLLHDYSGDFFTRKLEADAHKLEGPFAPGVSPLQLIVCASAREVREDASWQEWLGKFELWNRPHLERCAPLAPAGSLLVRAFG